MARRSFPPLPPDPYEEPQGDLLPLDEELYHHGGSYLYQPEGDRLGFPDEHDESQHFDMLRLPEDWQKPEPVTAFAEFLGADPIRQFTPGNGYAWEPRFVGYGQYSLLQLAFEENNQRRDGIGHQLLVELDLRLTGTERFHVQFRPLGRRNTGGSIYQFSEPDGYIDNSTAEPDRYWFEGEIASIFGGVVDPLAARDYHVIAGRFPFAMHNSLLMNDDIVGFAIGKNTIYLGKFSNINVQFFAGYNDVDTFANSDARAYGVNISADRRHAFYELTYAFVDAEINNDRDQHFLAASRVQMHGRWVWAARGLFKFGDPGGTGNGQLLVLESNYTTEHGHGWFGVERSVLYANAFYAGEGWNPIAAGNFDRLRSSFEVNPLVAITTGRLAVENYGVAVGTQFFRHHEDESFIPELAIEVPEGEVVFGCGLRYLRKLNSRTFIEVLGVVNLSDDPRFDREGIFIAETILF